MKQVKNVLVSSSEGSSSPGRPKYRRECSRKAPQAMDSKSIGYSSTVMLLSIESSVGLLCGMEWKETAQSV